MDVESLPGQTPPVFYDPAQLRWRRFRRVALLMAALLTIIFGVMVASILINPPLPQLGLSPIDRLLGRPVPTVALSPTAPPIAAPSISFKTLTVAASATPIRNVPSPAAAGQTPTFASQPKYTPTSDSM